MPVALPTKFLRNQPRRVCNCSLAVRWSCLVLKTTQCDCFRVHDGEATFLHWMLLNFLTGRSVNLLHTCAPKQISTRIDLDVCPLEINGTFLFFTFPFKHACACGGLLILCVCVQADLFHACLARRGVVEFDVSHYEVSHHSQLRAASSYCCVCVAPQQLFVFCNNVAWQPDLSLTTNWTAVISFLGNFIVFP